MNNSSPTGRAVNAFSNLAATDRKAFKALRKIYQAQLRTFPARLSLMSAREVEERSQGMEVPPLYVWRSRNFMVAEYREGDNMRLSVNRTLIDNEGNWLQGITWDELMECKRQIGYGNLWAIEIFPADEHIVDVAPMRHLWIVKIPPMAWVKVDKAAKLEAEEAP